MSVIDELRGVLLSYEIDYDTASDTELVINADGVDYMLKEKGDFIEVTVYPLTVKDVKDMLR